MDLCDLGFALSKISKWLGNWEISLGQIRFHKIWVYDAFWTDILYIALHTCLTISFRDASQPLCQPHNYPIASDLTLKYMGNIKW